MGKKNQIKHCASVFKRGLRLSDDKKERLKGRLQCGWVRACFRYTSAVLLIVWIIAAPATYVISGLHCSFSLCPCSPWDMVAVAIMGKSTGFH